MAPETDLGPYTDYDEHGVDLTLIRWMLSLTPAERLAAVEDCANFVLEARRLNGVPELSEDFQVFG
jgi:hypothetical protein